LTEADEHATPFLDRQLPLPRASSLKVSDISPTTWVVYTGLVIVSAAVAMHLLISHDAVFEEWVLRPDLGYRIGLAIAGMIGAYLAAITVHELGHVIGGLAAGFRFQHLRISLIILHRTKRLSLLREPNRVMTGEAKLLPQNEETKRSSFVAFVAGGPAANLLSALLVSFISPSPAATFFVVISVIVGLTELLPVPMLFAVTDGARLKMLYFDRPRGERWMAILQLSASSSDARSPEKMSPSMLAIATAISDASADTVTAHAMAYYNALTRKQYAEAGRFLEVCLRSAAHARPGVLEALKSDAVVFQAAIRHSPQLAGEWLKDLSPNAAPWLRVRAETTLLASTGFQAEAWKKLDHFEKTGAPEQHLLPLIEKWKSVLQPEGGACVT
jgi:hypothetical protein